jgi:hypothetical protein
LEEVKDITSTSRGEWDLVSSDTKKLIFYVKISQFPVNGYG